MQILIDSVMRLFQLEMTLSGFTFSFWDMFVFGWIIAIAGFLIRNIFSD